MQKLSTKNGIAALRQEAARRLIDGGGVSVNELKITDYGDLPSEITEKREFVLHKGKKVHLRIVLK